MTAAASALPLGGCNMTTLAPDPPICLRRLGFVTTQRVRVWRVMTKRTSAPRPAEGIPARQVGACHNALLSPGPQCVTTELTQAEKCGLLMVKVAIPVAQLYLVHVFQRSIPAGFFASRFPATTTKTPVQRSTVARSTRVDLRWQQRCVSLSICYDHGSSTGYRRCLKDHL